MLLGAQAPGTFALGHLDAAVRAPEQREARLIDDALALAGEAGAAVARSSRRFPFAVNEGLGKRAGRAVTLLARKRLNGRSEPHGPPPRSPSTSSRFAHRSLQR